jgi:hypothetical protein
VGQSIVFTGEQMGFLEPCGCAGLDNQKGGYMRRYTLLEQLRGKGWPLVPLDAGGMVRRYGPQAQIKLQRSFEALIKMQYDVIGFGAKELRLDVLSEAANLSPNPLTSANIGLVDFESGFTQRYKIVEQGGYRIGVTAVLGEQLTKEASTMSDLVTMPPAEAIAEVLPELLAQKCDQLVLLSYARVDETKKLAAKFPQFKWVVAAQGGDEPPYEPIELVPGKQYLIEVGHKGMYAVVIGLYRQGEPEFRYQKVPLDHRFEDAPAMKQLMVDYQHQLETLGLEALTRRAIDHPQGGQFAGSEACMDCHSTAHEVWINSPHAHATKTLEELTPPRHHDPECLSCHVTGWDPQGYSPYTSGYESLTKTPHLTTNGCENCHGPAKKHVDAENGDIDVTDEEREALYAALRMEIVENEGNMDGQVDGKVVANCMLCHDVDNSPEFDFQKYWEMGIKHEGKD